MEAEHYQMLADALKKHDARSDERACEIKELIESQTGGATMHGKDEVEIKNIFSPGHGEGGGMGGLGTAAVISAMGNRNEAGGLAALAPLLAGRHHDYGAGALGAGALGFVAGALVSGRRGGLFGGGDGDGGGAETRISDSITGTAVLTKLGSIEAAIPLAEAQTQLAIQTQTNQLSTLASTNNNMTLGAISGVKDSVQNLSLFLSNQINAVNQNVSEQGCKTREVVQAGTTAVLTALKDSTIAQLQAELAEQRGHSRSRDVEVNVTQNVAQAQAQAQQQQQINSLLAQFPLLFATIQSNRNGQDTINFGTMAGSGNQANAQNNVR